MGMDSSAQADDLKVNCDACPILCRISPGKTGSCGRYGNADGTLIRTDPVVLANKMQADQGEMVPFLGESSSWDGSLLAQQDTFLTAIGTPAQPIRTTSPRPSSSPASMRGWTW